MAVSMLPTFETRSPIARLTEGDAASLDQYREMVSRMLRADREEILSLSKVLGEVESLNAKLADEKERQIAHNEDLREKQAVLELNQKLKKDLLHRARSEQTERLRAYQSAKAAEGELESVLSRFNLAAEVKKQKEVEEIAAAPPAAPALVPHRPASTFAARKGGLGLPIEGRIVSAFGRKYDPKASLYTFHKGIDIANNVGTPVLASRGGQVISAGWNEGGYGYLVEIRHDDGSMSRYGHNSQILVRAGDMVSQGSVISLMGSTGRSTGPHLHFEILPPGRGAVNPLQFLPAKA